MTDLASLRTKLLSDPEVKAEYDRLGPIYGVVDDTIEARQSAVLHATRPPSGADPIPTESPGSK
jgi:hypothetical protein